MSYSDPSRARVFGAFAEDYQRWRPGYPNEAVDWLVPPHARRVADVGAGTGKLTGLLIARGLQVVAVEPDAGMLAVLVRVHPAAEVHLAGADQLPLPDASVDAVLVAQAWHWFPHEQALDEARRVVRPSGWLGLISNGPAPGEPWQLELARVDPDTAGSTFRDKQDDDWDVTGVAPDRVQRRTFRWQEQITAAGLSARLATHSAYITMDAEEREQRLEEVGSLVAAEAARRGSATVPFGHTAYCARVRL